LAPTCYPTYASSNTTSDAGIEFVEVFLVDGVVSFFFLLFCSQKQVGESIEPSLVPLTSGRSEDNFTTGRHNNQGLPVQARRVSIAISNDPNRLNGDTLRLQHVSTSRAGVFLAPVESPGIWMHPEKASMSGIRGLAPSSFPCVLPQVLADHSLGDGLDHAWICSRLDAFWINELTALDIESFIKLGSE
jgi:hypothetical protein